MTGTFRVVSWNVRSLRDDSAGVAAFLRSLRPDVVLLQEAPRLLGSSVANLRLAHRAGLRRTVGGASGCGNLLLVSRRVRVVDAHAVRLPRRRGLHRRGAVLAVLAVDGCRLGVLGTHLDLDPSARLDTASTLRAALPADPPLLVGADLNEEPGMPAWQTLSVGLVDLAADLGPTFPQREPRRRIDGLFADPAFQVERVLRPDPGPVTDHLPLVADLGAGQLPT
ncbi:MAG: putative endonuclease/exonuclease/phosphatase-family protein [Frankiales bacterium]|nr:putative endonuclease/exonuclease/phosphatase-family protein [Frankiales bacterium]